MLAACRSCQITYEIVSPIAPGEFSTYLPVHGPATDAFWTDLNQLGYLIIGCGAAAGGGAALAPPLRRSPIPT